MNTVMAPWPLASPKERHVVQVIGSERDAHMCHTLGVAAHLKGQTVRAADETSRTGHHHETLATKLRKDRLGSRQVSHGSAPSDWPPAWVAQSAARVQNLTQISRLARSRCFVAVHWQRWAD